MAHYLNLPSLVALSQLNREGNQNTQPLLLGRAQAYGYKGKEMDEAKVYLQGLFCEILWLYPSDKISSFESRFEPERITETCIALFSCQKMYEENFKYLFKYFAKCLIAYPNSDLINQMDPLVLCMQLTPAKLISPTFF
jgi:hypothetical protein